MLIVFLLLKRLGQEATPKSVAVLPNPYGGCFELVLSFNGLVSDILVTQSQKCL